MLLLGLRDCEKRGATSVTSLGGKGPEIENTSRGEGVDVDNISRKRLRVDMSDLIEAGRGMVQAR